MQIGVFAKSFEGDRPATVLAASRDAGFSTVQYNMACSGLGSLPGTISEDTAREVREASAGTGIGIAAISATYNMTDPDPERLVAGRRAFTAICERAPDMGCRILTVCSGSKHAHDKWCRHPSNDDQQSWTEMCREFDIICNHADQHGVLIGVEPEPANIVSDAGRAVDLLAAFPGSPIRMVLDPANLIEDVAPDKHKRTIDEALVRLGPMTVLAHAKDRYADGTVAPAGDGVVDWPHFLRGLKACGFDGPLIAHGMSQSNAPGVAGFLTSQMQRLGS